METAENKDKVFENFLPVYILMFLILLKQFNILNERTSRERKD